MRGGPVEVRHGSAGVRDDHVERGTGQMECGTDRGKEGVIGGECTLCQV